MIESYVERGGDICYDVSLFFEVEVRAFVEDERNCYFDDMYSPEYTT